MARKLPRGGLKKLLKWWQTLLGIADWQVTLKREFIKDFPDPDAHVQIAEYARTAIIWIDPRSEDAELSLVHELLHVAHSMALRSRVSMEGEENFIWAMTRALVALKRKAYAEEDEGTQGVQGRETQRKAKR